jgi:predicted methyltransferase
MTSPALDAVFADHGVHVRPLRLALTLLGHGWQRFDDLVRATAAPRRNVQELLDALGEDVERRDTSVRLLPSARENYAAYGLAPAADPLDEAVAAHGDLLDELTRKIAAVPPALAALDHVQATPRTVLRRALWLDERYDLDRARLLFLGDHDLTSLAVRALRPNAPLTVVDLDERVLAYLDPSITTLHADLRVGLPPALAGSADLVFSDPPYTPEGMGLFAARGVEALAHPPKGRLLLAYGYSTRHPALGAQVQRSLASLGLAFEAILPDFHRYEGAQAIGSAADLYVCQPTARSAGGGRSRSRTQPGIYTHGPQSVEAGDTPAGLMDAVRELAEAGGLAVTTRPADWSAPGPGLPRGGAMAVDLSADPGPWLLRVLLAVNATRVAVLVPNGHPDLADAKAQASLRALIGTKYRLRLLRSTPDRSHAVVIADAVTEPDPVLGTVLARAHGKLGNVLREALVAASGGTLTKNDARARVATLVGEDKAFRLIDLPRHRLAELVGAVHAANGS